MTRDELKEKIQKKWSDKMIKLMMRGTTERYALFFSWGLTTDSVKWLNLQGSAFECWSSLLAQLYSWQRSEDFDVINLIVESVENAQLPEGIPEE